MAEIELPSLGELEEVKEKRFTRRVALVTAIFAVMLAITSLGGNNAMKEMLLAQQQASDQWSFYQAKVIREHLYRQQKQRLELDLLEKETLKPEVKTRYEALLQQTAKEADRYGMEKKDIKKEAEKLGCRFHHHCHLGRSNYFDCSLYISGNSITVVAEFHSCHEG